ncbi:uncharacterized protein LOC121585049 isoform X1 [Coregonus clupeaformis]|uniref:uncharacterized protein LOC121585049 isoform X1 n=1 Tax=Coregonus clupeaformis TaxID=59861 RepID=UPI001E1C2AAD|nr:uncharacterized protein LOC121585049 isoform X1 [Coregonus clupeaformis]
MAPGSTRKLCPSCKTSIGVASKKCKFCGAKIQLKVKLEAQKMKATDEWANKTMKHGRYTTLINAANKLVHRFHKIGVYPLLLLSKRKKDNIWSSTALCPHSGMMNQTSMAAIQRFYEVIVKEAINTHAPTPQPSNPPPVAAQELSDTVAPQETDFILTQVEPPISPTTQETSYTPILNQVEPPITPTTQETSYTILNQVEPPIIPTAQETSYTQTEPKKTGRKSCHSQKNLQPAEQDTVNPIQLRPRKRKYDYMQKECPVHPGQTIFPILEILANRTSKEGQEQKVRWKPCSGCGKKWDDDWIKAVDWVSPV